MQMQTLFEFLAVCPLLQEFEMIPTGYIFDAYGEWAKHGGWGWITSLFETLQKLPHLHKLKFAPGQYSLQLPRLMDALTELPQLETLEVCNFDDRSFDHFHHREQFRPTDRKLPHLRKLVFGQNQTISAEFLKTVVDNCCSLEEFRCAVGVSDILNSTQNFKLIFFTLAAHPTLRTLNIQLHYFCDDAKEAEQSRNPSFNSNSGSTIPNIICEEFLRKIKRVFARTSLELELTISIVYKVKAS